MADCVALRQSSGYNDISLEIKNFLPKLPPLFPITSLQQYNSTKQAINNERGKVQNLKSKLDAAVAQLEAGGCSARSVGAGAPYGAIERLERELDLNTQTVEREWERTQEAQAATAQKAAATQNNAGTGVPGTAGTGPGASPAPAPSPTIVTGPTGASAPATTATGATGPKPVTPAGGAPTGPTGTAGSATPAAGTTAPYATDTNRGLPGATQDAQAQASRQDAANYATKGDWRVRLALAPGAKYLYDLPDDQSSGILAPLRATDGVIFPYTPQITVNYAANYEPTEVTHSNYKIFQYRNSAVDNISIVCDFTAQDTHEANYLLAVIHFFRTVTKMFYGKDQDPKAGTPPPLCYIYGLGQFQFNAHPLLITNFTYSLPGDVDYIRATTNTTTAPLVNKSAGNTPNDTNNVSNQRISQSPSGVAAGGVPNKPTYSTTSSGTVEPTYIPTKITITVQAVPVVARNDISQQFSLKDYATGKLLVGSKRAGRGGIW